MSHSVTIPPPLYGSFTHEQYAASVTQSCAGKPKLISAQLHRDGQICGTCSSGEKVCVVLLFAGMIVFLVAMLA